MKNLAGLFMRSSAAGVMIGMGGTAFLSCDNKYIGALLFCVALVSICALNMSLYTGAIGYAVTEKRLKKPLASYPTVLLGNFAGAGVCALLVSLSGAAANGRIGDLCAGKLQQAPYQTLILAVLCGVLMYVAVDFYKKHGGVTGILFCIPVFILCGFEHSIADTFYLMLGKEFSLKALGYILLTVAGNSAGAIGIALLLEKMREEKAQDKEL